MQRRIVNYSKSLMWRYIITPVFPFGRAVLLKMNIIRHSGRQPWRLGWLKSEKSLGEFIEYLHSQNFRNNFIAWVDDGQIISLRQLNGFEYQYHIRVFKDGEVRGHYEFTPEAYPIRHIKEHVFEPRSDDFSSIIKDWLVDYSPGMELMPIMEYHQSHF